WRCGSKRPPIPGRTVAPAAACRQAAGKTLAWCFGRYIYERVVPDRAVLLGSGGSLPAIRQELVNAALGPARGQFPKYVGEVRKRRDTAQREVSSEKAALFSVHARIGSLTRPVKRYHFPR